MNAALIFQPSKNLSILISYYINSRSLLNLFLSNIHKTLFFLIYQHRLTIDFLLECKWLDLLGILKILLLFPFYGREEILYESHYFLGIKRWLRVESMTKISRMRLSLLLWNSGSTFTYCLVEWGIVTI